MNDYINQCISEHQRAVESLIIHASTLESVAKLLIETFEDGNTLYIFGNGGSAADSQHIAAELVGRFKKKDRPALPAISLTTDTSNLTAIGNDFGFTEIFCRQVDAFVRPGDVVWALSVSGTSPNIISAVKLAKERRAKIIGFTSKKGHELKELSDICLYADHIDSDRVQEIHQISYHIICELIEMRLS